MEYKFVSKLKLKDHSKSSKYESKTEVKNESKTEAKDEAKNEEFVESSLSKAELKFREFKRKRAFERAKKLSKMSHKERVFAYNSYLDSLSEHNDIPKVGPG